jgi:hypothetical protein
MKLSKHANIYLLPHSQEEKKAIQYLVCIVPKAIGAFSGWEGRDTTVVSGAPTTTRVFTDICSNAFTSIDV